MRDARPGQLGLVAREGGSIRVFLVRSSDIRWDGLRAMLAELPNIEIVGDVESVLQAEAQIPAVWPAVICASGDPDDVPVSEFVRRLQTIDPHSRMLVIGEGADHGTLRELARLGARGYVLWQDVNVEVAHASVLAVNAELRVGSDAVLDELLLASRETGEIKAAERAILAGLAKGLNEAQIASSCALSVRSVERAIADLKQRVCADSLFVLGVWAATAGLLDTEEDDGNPPSNRRKTPFHVERQRGIVDVASRAQCKGRR